MEIKEFENQLKSDVQNIIESIIEKNLCPKIKTNGGRVGDQISKYLENEFFKAPNTSKIDNKEKSPQGKTKNPWDAKFDYKSNGIKITIGIDFKTIKEEQSDSNPDMGSADKIFNENSDYDTLYMLFIVVKYTDTDNKVKFVKMSNNNYSDLFFLKDISETFRRTPTNQLQVNVNEEAIYRTRSEFIELLKIKLEENSMMGNSIY